MSGDVQPRKRKDKKKKKDELGVEEPRGTAAALGEGDVFMHSQSDHGTGGHWCAKIIFFSLLGVLITLVGLIILENRGLTELEANSVESRYSGVLEGWIEDVADDDHHDEHTLELSHHDDDGDEDHGSEFVNDDEHDEDDDDDDEGDGEHDVDDNEDDEDADGEINAAEQDDDDSEEEQHVNDSEDDNDDDDDEDDDDQNDDDEDDENPESTEQDLNTADNEDEIDETFEKKYGGNIGDANEDDNDDTENDSEEENYDKAQNKEINDDDDADLESDELIKNDDDEEDRNDDDDDGDGNRHHFNEIFEENDQYNEDSPRNNIDYEDDDSQEGPSNKEDDDDHEEEDEPANIEIETIEKEVTDDDAVSAVEPTEEDEEQSQDVSEDASPEEDGSVEDDDVEFLEPDELDELPIVEPITAPKGKPLAEVGEAPSTEKPQDTLADEEEYERQQEELRREREQASQGMWLKLTVGGALLVATHAVLRRATASRETDTEDEPEIREDTPLSDRRMTLVPEPVSPSAVAAKTPEFFRHIEKEDIKETTVEAPPPIEKDDDDEEEEEIKVNKPGPQLESPKVAVDKELYSDEDELEEEIEEDEEEIEPPMPQQPIKPQQTPSQPYIPDVTKEVTPEPDEEDEDVEIIDEDLLEEEMEEEISDVDDAELLNRLEAKYGRLHEPDRPPRANKDGGNSVEEWPGEPADEFWSEQLDQAERDLREGAWQAALAKAEAPGLRGSGRARLVAARALDRAADAQQDNQLLSRAIAAYLELLKMNERMSDAQVLEVAARALDRIKFRGTYLSAEPVYKLLIRRFPNEPSYRNNLTISFLMANRADLAENVITETLKLWPDDRIALAHLGFILKTSHNRLEEAVDAFSRALEGDTGPANEPRFYYHLGDALLLLGRFSEAEEVHKRGAALGHFLSPVQRSLYNVDRLKSQPWWDVNQTPYADLARSLERSWREILREGEAAAALYEQEKEGLRERGEWSQLELFARGREVGGRCGRAPATCGAVRREAAARGCRRGQVKFSLLAAGTHVRPHVGPTNCRLRMHLGLSNTEHTYIRVDKEIRQWQVGKVLMFDDSFEHEVWHNGTGPRLVLIVDVWHPDLSPAERARLPAI